MLKQIKTLIIVVGLIVSFSEYVYAGDLVEINQLVENADDFDEQTVKVTGEAVGEKMKRGDHAWINIYDGSNAIGIWMDEKDAEKVQHYGSYKYKGDMLNVTGTFNKTCQQHGGESDIHVISLEIEEKGQETVRPVSSLKVSVAVLSATLAASLFTLFVIETGHRIK
ncbi:MAG: DNA-binding protein [Sedimentibacter sp.]|uniref:DNA-binding protein n=1 Tax=Sedimentibacter sp. TaxID=1960295 RepID=UPI0031591F5A